MGIAGMAGWLLTARAANPIRAAIVGTVLFLLGLTAALTLLTASEYGQTLVPTWLGVVNLLPVAIGLLITIHLWRSSASRFANRVRRGR
jgi:protein-S-isoprenylcysteine O-methyltransferase Ste14